MFFIMNMRLGRHVSASQDEYRTSRIEIRLSDLIYSFRGST